MKHFKIKKNVLGVAIVLSLVICITQLLYAKSDDRSNSYSLAKHYYNDKDYLKAYKYLLIYEYSHYEQLRKPENNNFLKSIDEAANYCESQIQLAMTGSSKFVGKAWKDEEIKTNVKSSVSPPPILPSNQIKE